MKIKIYILSPFESKMAKRGTRHPRLAEFLCESKFSVEYITTNFSHARKEYFSKDEIKHYQDNLPYKLTVLKIFGYNRHISIRRVCTHIYLAIKYLFFLLLKAKKGDILVFPSRPPELIFCVWLLKWFIDIKTVMDIRDVWPDSLKTSNRFKNFVFKAYCNMFLYVSIKRIDKFVHTAPSFVRWLQRYAPNRHSKFIPLGYDTNRWPDPKPITENDLKDRINLVYVGGLSHQIDLTHIINALRKNDKFFLTIIGDGEDFGKVTNLVKNNGMKNVELMGYLPYSEVVKELRRMHLALLPMIGFAMPNKLFDYIASYRPILVVGRNDSSNFVEKYDVGWTKKFDFQEIKEFFEKITFKEIIKKSENIAKIRYNFSKENLYKEYVRIIVN